MKRLVLFVIMLITAVSAAASGGREQILNGNKAYAAGKYDEALQYYANYDATNPESPYTAFNRGITYFRKEDYEAARKDFQAASIKTKDLALEAKASYNLGNCAFMQAGREADSDLEKAVQMYYESIDFYKRALELNPKMENAAYNLEVTRLILKDMLDKQKQQQQQNQEQQDKIKKIVEKLAALVEKEGKLIAGSQALDEEKQTQGVSASLRNTAGKLKNEQAGTRKETSGVSGEIQKLSDESLQGAAAQGQQQQLPADNPLVTAKSHVDRSANFQSLAETQLAETKTAETITTQESARDELIKAIEALSQPQDQQQQQQSEDQKKADEQKQQQEQAAAEDVIDQEKENKDQREQQAQGGYYAPAKDW